MNTQTDQELLREYAERRSEAAFAELAGRYVDLVHSAALRMVGDSHCAADVTQEVFVALARNAAQLARHPVLSGWLHCTAHHLAANIVRANVRRQAREQESAMNQLSAAEPVVSWEEIAPHLDAALRELGESERDAVLLRYFEKKSGPEMAVALDISEEAAQKRVSRAVEKLREFFAKRKIAVGAGGLAVLISANAVQSAPAGVVAGISAAALAGTAVTSSTFVATATQTIAMSTLQKTIVIATVAALSVAGIFEARQAAQLRDEVQRLQQRQGPTAEEIQKLRDDFADATNRVAGLLAENSRLKSSQPEVLKLRSEVTRLRNDLALAQSKSGDESKDNPAGATNTYISTIPLSERISRIRAYLAEHPEAGIPEIQFASAVKWLNSIQGPVGDDQQMANALTLLRRQAMSGFMSEIRIAEIDFEKGNDGHFPDTLTQLLPYMDPAKGQVMLDNYEIAPAKTITDPNAHINGDWVILRKSAVNPISNSPMEREAAYAGGQSAWYVSDARD